MPEVQTTVFTVQAGPSSVAAPFPLASFTPQVTAAKKVPVDPLAQNSPQSQNLIMEEQPHLREDPISFGRQLAAWFTGSGWRAYNNYIGAPILFPELPDLIIQRVISAEPVRARINMLAQKRVRSFGNDSLTQEERATLELQVKKQLEQVAVDEMRSELVARMTSIGRVRFLGAVVSNIIARMYYQGVHISLPQIMELRQVALEAQQKKQSIFFLPCHKSHIDYMTIAFLLFRLGFSLPHIVAGENLNLPIVGQLLSGAGALFIRRSFGDDQLYPQLVQEYIVQLLLGGYNLECFVEGGRSRTGKLLPPKLGILKYVVSALESGRVPDVVICPISLQYDRVIETESYINELMGKSKQAESLMGLINNTSVLQLKMGRIDVRFGKCFGLRSFLEDQSSKRSGLSFTSGSILSCLGYRVLSDINNASTIMPAALLGSIFLTLRGKGIGKTQLVNRVRWLVNTVQTHGGNVATFANMTLEEVVDRTLYVLRDEIGQVSGTVEPTFYAAKRFELSFYRNQIIHVFVNESLSCVSLYTRVKQPGFSSLPMSFDDVMSELAFVSRLLKREFVYPSGSLEENALSTIELLEKDNVFTVDRAKQTINLSPEELQTGRENFDFYCFLIWPFIESYWLCLVSLFALVPDSPQPHRAAWVADKPFRSAVQTFGRTLYHQGDISYLEAINHATIDNAFAYLIEIGLLLHYRKPTSRAPISLIALHPDWVPSPTNNSLPEMLSRLGAFRREGKSRRDTSEVSERVFRNLGYIRPSFLEYTTADRTAAHL